MSSGSSGTAKGSAGTVVVEVVVGATVVGGAVVVVDGAVVDGALVVLVDDGGTATWPGSPPSSLQPSASSANAHAAAPTAPRMVMG